MTLLHRIAIMALVLGLAAVACGRNWDDYDPRLTDETANGSGGVLEGSGGTTGVGGGGGQGGAPGLCGGVGVLTDDFDDGEQSPLMDGAGQENDGQLVIPVPSNENFGYYGSLAYYLLEGRAVSLEVVSAPLDAGFYFSLDTANGDWIEFQIADGDLQADFCLDGDCKTSNSVPYDEEAHRFWRISQENNTVYYEVSADGSDWQMFSTTLGLGIDEPLTLNIGFYDSTPSQQERQITVDNLSATPEPHCPPSIEDDFEDGVADPRWTLSWGDDGVSLSEPMGVFEVYLEAGVTTEGSAIETKQVFDLRGATITLEVVDGVGPNEPGQVWFLLGSLDEHDALILNPDVETLYLHEVIDDNWNSVLIPYDPQSMRWIRFREEDGLVHYEVSPSKDGPFVTLHSATPAFDISATHLIIGGAGSSDGLTQPHQVQLDNFSALVP